MFNFYFFFLVFQKSLMGNKASSLSTNRSRSFFFKHFFLKLFLFFIKYSSNWLNFLLLVESPRFRNYFFWLANREMLLHVKTPKRFAARRTFHWEILQRKWALNGLQFLHIQRIPSKTTRVRKEILFPSLVQCRHMSICGATKCTNASIAVALHLMVGKMQPDFEWNRISDAFSVGFFTVNICFTIPSIKIELQAL